MFNSVLVEINEETGLAERIERVDREIGDEK
jgi:calcineurin-like phosphoesterase